MFPNLVLRSGEEGRNQRKDYQVGGAGGRNIGRGNVNQEAAALKLDAINQFIVYFSDCMQLPCLVMGSSAFLRKNEKPLISHLVLETY